MVKIYLASIANVTDSIMENQIPYFHPLRREKIRSNCQKNDKKRSFVAGYLIKKALEENGVDYASSEFAQNEYGKVFIPGSSVYFNVSHSGDCVMCITAASSVGCDVEYIEPDTSEKEIAIKKNMAKIFLSDGEREILFFKQGDAFLNNFYGYWTLKESAVKCIGRGMSFPLEEIPIDIAKSSAQSIMLHSRHYRLRGWKKSGYCFAVCVEAKPTEKIECVMQYVSV